MMFAWKKWLVAGAVATVMQGVVAKEVIDIAGRTVTVPDKVERVALGEGRMIYAVSLVQENPVEKVVAWRDDIYKTDPDFVAKLAEKFPKTKDISQLGDPYATDVSVEALIKDNPQVYLLNIGNRLKAEETGLIEKLEKAGVAVVFIDFRQFPLQNTIPSMMILGEVFDEQARANKFINYYRQQLALVANRLEGVKEEDRPLVFIEAGAGNDPDKCCRTWGPQNYGEFIARAGGINWGSTKISGFSGNVNPEVIFSTPFDVIIGTGSNWKASKETSQAVVLGYAADKAAAQQALQALAARKGWGELQAVKNKRFHSIYHQFYNSPYHFIAIQTLAKWLHPERFADFDPEQSFADFHKMFMPFEYSGVFWTTLE